MKLVAVTFVALGLLAVRESAESSALIHCDKPPLTLSCESVNGVLSQWISALDSALSLTARSPTATKVKATIFMIPPCFPCEGPLLSPPIIRLLVRPPGPPRLTDA